MTAVRRPVPAIASAAEFSRLMAEVFPGDEVQLPPHAEVLLHHHAPLPNQRPATCGAYVLTYLLPARGFSHLDGESLAAEDYIAHLERLTITAAEDPASYRFAVSASADRSLQGASPDGVARAISVGTAGSLSTVPIPGRGAAGRPQLDERTWDALLDIISPRFIAGELDVIFNYASDELLAARDDLYNAETLGRADASAVIPRDRWGVGHFATMTAIWRRPSGERWVVLLNSFKERGFAGVEPQPAELMRRAAVREDQRGGGVLLVVPSGQAEALLELVARIGLEVRAWDNGSPAPEDWRWIPGR